MLAGVSHDLRTILTRFKLELELIGDSPEVDGMRKDVDEMSGMLEDYLAFARGDSGEQAQPTDMAVALEHVHDSGFVHMDFKPENVLVTRNANVRLVDFDLALPKPEKPIKRSKNPGTPAYMAPELLQRQVFDHRADIFAYGVTAYEALTGEKPFAGETPAEILRKQLNRKEAFVSPRQLNPEIPFALEKAILKCLEADPDQRYPITSVLVHDLKTALYV